MFTEVVCAILQHENRVLLALRPEGKRLGGFWEFPGGKVERGETAEAALHRELAEELGCAVRVTHELPACDHTYDWGSIRLLPFICELTAESVAPMPHEHAELVWALPEEMGGYSLAPADLPVLAHFLAMQAGRHPQS